MTEEQQKIIEAVKTEPLVKISAVSGAGKTTTLVNIAKTLNISGIYLAYNKAIATEAKQKFPRKIQCSTIHSLAYRNTIKQYKLTIGYFGVKEIKEHKNYLEKIFIIDIMELFFSSEYVTFDEYIKSKYYIKKRNFEDEISYDFFELYSLAKKYIQKMFAGNIPITHSGYLKMFHILLANKKIELKYDLLMIDEGGDLVPVTYEIFKLINAKRKVIAGDQYQMIYLFNNTINAFTVDNNGIILQMTKSFRCDNEIAKKVERFMQKYIDRHFRFVGSTVDKKNIQTVAYISRTNSALIATIIDMYKTGKKYNLTRKVSQIFDLVMSLIMIKKQPITIPEYLFLNDEIRKYRTSEALKEKYNSELSFIASEFADDIGLKAAITVITTHGPEIIIEAYYDAKKYENTNQRYPITITTAHASKGLEFDKVIINDDMNKTLEKVLNELLKGEKFTENRKTEFLLYYVACTRAKKLLYNANYLN